MTTENKNNLREISDDELDNVSGGVMYSGETWEVGDRVAVNVRCAYCGKSGSTGAVSVVYRPKRDGIFRVSAVMDCCAGVATYIVSDGQISKL